MLHFIFTVKTQKTQPDGGRTNISCRLRKIFVLYHPIIHRDLWIFYIGDLCLIKLHISWFFFFFYIFFLLSLYVLCFSCFHIRFGLTSLLHHYQAARLNNPSWHSVYMPFKTMLWKDLLKKMLRCYDIAKLCINIEVLQASLGNLNKDLTASMQSSVAPWWLLLHLRHDDSCISESIHTFVPPGLWEPMASCTTSLSAVCFSPKAFCSCRLCSHTHRNTHKLCWDCMIQHF